MQSSSDLHAIEKVLQYIAAKIDEFNVSAAHSPVGEPSLIYLQIDTLISVAENTEHTRRVRCLLLHILHTFI